MVCLIYSPHGLLSGRGTLFSFVSNHYVMFFFPNTARILRGLRIAARLGLSLSKDIETAIPEFVSSVANLGQVF